MVRKRGLGKSLDALLSYTNVDNTAYDQDAHDRDNFADGSKLSLLSVTEIEPGKYQPRRDMDVDALNELANSIRQQGILQPLIVRPIDHGHRYEIIAGERRFRAAQIAGLNEVPVIIRHIPDEAAIAIALIENIQREDLNPIEEAIALNRLIAEFGLTHQQVAEAVGKSRVSVTNLLRLLQLPDIVKILVAEKQLEMGHARTLITLPETVQLETAQLIVTRGLSVRETELLVKRLQAPQKNTSKETDPDILHLQEKLSKQFKIKVAIRCNQKGRGKLIFHYKNLRELDALVAQIAVVSS